MEVHIFGSSKSQDTKKALRFFKERGMRPHFVDLSKGKTAPGELQRFVARAGAAGLIDTAGKAYLDSGLAYMRLTDDDLLARALENPKLLKQPLVRSGNLVAVGWDEAFWREALKKETN